MTEQKNGVSNELNDAMINAVYRMWVDELNAVDNSGRPAWSKRRIAAEEICSMVGIHDLIRAISLDGELRPPPPWPKVDCVPIGGGVGLITCEVRTMHPKHGKLTVPIGLACDKKFNAEQISEAMERGKFELRKLIANRT